MSWMLLLPIAVAVALAAAILLRAQWALRGTTLVAPGRWALVSLLVTAAIAGLDGMRGGSPDAQAPWRYIAATSTLCPGIALLGAKRPQDRPWQWIVASLWLVIALPAVQWLALNKSGQLEPHTAISWFLFALWGLGCVNSGCSRFAPAVLLAGAGQGVLLAPFLPISFGELAATPPAWGVAAMAAAVCLVWWQSRRPIVGDPWDRVWIDFRSQFGLLWALRFQEQVNTFAQSQGWNVFLAWSGFRATGGAAAVAVSPEQLHSLQQSIRNLLRRFVSPAWIASRLDADRERTISQGFTS